MAVTLQQIAEAAGVSRGTVDRALNNRGRIRPEVEERIKRIAREMGYQPSRAGRALAMAKRKIRIGVKGGPGSKRRSGEFWRNSKDL